MKNKILSLLFSVILIFIISVSSAASGISEDNFNLLEDDNISHSDESLPDNEKLVIDKADLLSDEEEQLLRNRLAKLREEYSIEAAILTVKDFEGKTAQAFADDWYDYKDYGFGPDDDGLILVYKDGEPGNRELYLSTYGICLKQFTDFDVDNILSDFQNNLLDSGIFEAYSVFIDYCNDNLYRYFQGISDAEYEEQLKDNEKVHPMWIPLSLIIGFVVAYIIMRSAAAPLKSVRKNVNAADYVRSGSMNLTVSRDRFLYKNVTKTAKPKDTDSGSSGSSGRSTTHTSSSGRTHGGGGSKF